MFITDEEIPYLKDCPRDGRLRPLISFFDGRDWHSYLQQPDEKLLHVGFTNLVSGVYLAKKTASEADVEVPLLTFLFQYFPTQETFKAINVLDADLENCLTVLHKQFILFRYFAQHEDRSDSQVVATELEYAIFNHRSAYDLLNRLAIAFLKRHGYQKKTIPDSFRRVAEKSESERIAYGFSGPLSRFYEAKRASFMVFRAVRDAIGHHGQSVDLIFKLPNGFGISGTTLVGKQLKTAGLWDAMKPIQNDIGSCFAFLALLANDLFTAVSDFAIALAASFEELPKETAPGYQVFARSGLSEHRSRLADYLANPWCFGPTPSSVEK